MNVRKVQVLNALCSRAMNQDCAVVLGHEEIGAVPVSRVDEGTEFGTTLYWLAADPMKRPAFASYP